MVLRGDVIDRLMLHIRKAAEGGQKIGRAVAVQSFEVLPYVR